MYDIFISVRDLVAIKTGDEYYVCGNSDFMVHFDFDAAWDNLPTKTARFICEDGRYFDQVFTGSDCPVPVITNTNNIRVGVFAGNLTTTTPARVRAGRSILCGNGTPSAPADDVYSQIMQKVNEAHDDMLEATAGAVDAAGDAKSAADNAQASADAAQTVADNAQASANAADSKADNAQASADAAQTAADKAQASADSAQETAYEADAKAENALAEIAAAYGDVGGLFLVTSIPNAQGVLSVNRTKDEILSAIADKKTCILVTYAGEVCVSMGTMAEPVSGEIVPVFLKPIEYVRVAGLVYARVYVNQDGELRTLLDSDPAKTPNPHKLTFTGAATGEYDGSEGMRVHIPVDAAKLHITTVTWSGEKNAYVSDCAFAEIVAAVDDGRTCLAVNADSGVVFPFAAMTDNGSKAVFSRLFKTAGGVWQNYYIEIANDETVSLMGEEIRTNNPYKLTFTGAVTGEYDGSKALEIEIPDGGGSNLPEASGPHQMLVTDGSGKEKWEERTHYKEKSIANLLYQATLQGEDPIFALTTAMDSEPVVGQTYTLIWDGQTYSSPCEDVTSLTGIKTYGFGDLTLATEGEQPEGVTNPQPGAPYFFAYSPDAASDGAYGMIISMDTTTNPILSISGTVETISTLDEKYLPESVRNANRQITLTIDADGNVTSDTDFETAWAMTNAQLQAAINIRKPTKHYGVDAVMVSAPEDVIRIGTSGNEVMEFIIRYRDYTPIDDGSTSHEAKYIHWAYYKGSGLKSLVVAKQYDPGLPHVSSYNYGSGVVCFDEERDVYEIVNASSMSGKTDYIRPFLPVFTAADAGKVLGIDADGNLAWVSPATGT